MIRKVNTNLVLELGVGGVALPGVSGEVLVLVPDPDLGRPILAVAVLDLVLELVQGRHVVAVHDLVTLSARHSVPEETDRQERY